MYEIRLHGLGGEGVVRLSEFIGKTAMNAGMWAHSFPFFGTEVRGAAVKAFTRVDEKPISIKSYIYEPDVLLITNDILLDNPEVTKGLKPDTLMLINTRMNKKELEERYHCKVFPILATDIGYEIIGKPIVNTTMFGALIGLTDVVPLETAKKVLQDEFESRLAETNLACLKRGYDEGRGENA